MIDVFISSDRLFIARNIIAGKPKSNYTTNIIHKTEIKIPLSWKQYGCY